MMNKRWAKRIFEIMVVSILAVCVSIPAMAARLEVWINESTNNTRRWWVQEFYPAWRREHPDVEIAVYWQDWGSFQEKLVTATVGGVAPDVFQAGAEFVWEMAEGGLARPLDDYLSKWDMVDEYFPITWETVTHKGSVYGLPVLSAPRTLLYRTDLLRRFGYSDNDLPTTWDELHDMSVRLTRGDDERIDVLGFDPEWSFHKYFAFLWQNGGHVLDPGLERAAFDEPAGVEALEFIQTIAEDVMRGRTVRAGVGFRQGLVAIQYDSQHALRNIKEYRESDLQFVKVGLPLTRVEQVTPVFNDWLAISRHSKQPDLSWEFITFFSQPEHLSRYNETLFFIPPTKGAVQEARYLFDTPGLLTFVDILQSYARPVPSFPAPARLADALNNAIGTVVNNQRTAQAALTAAALEFNNELARAAAE